MFGISALGGVHSRAEGMENAARKRFRRDRPMKSTRSHACFRRMKTLSRIAPRILSALLVELRDLVGILLIHVLNKVVRAPIWQPILPFGGNVAKEALTRAKPHETPLTEWSVKAGI